MDIKNFEINDGVLVKYNGGSDNIIIPTGITKIADEAFFNCGEIVTVVIPEGVIQIGTSAFQNCCNLKSVEIPTSKKKIGRWAFKNCHSLLTINIPDNVTVILDCTFAY